MALKLNKSLTTKGGLNVPTNNIVTSALHFPYVTVNIDENGNPNGTYTRRITYDLRNYMSEAELIKNGDNYIQGGVAEFPSGYEKNMSDKEYTELLSNGALAEEWLKEYIDSIMGKGTCTIIDPYK